MTKRQDSIYDVILSDPNASVVIMRQAMMAKGHRITYKEMEQQREIVQKVLSEARNKEAASIEAFKIMILGREKYDKLMYPD